MVTVGEQVHSPSLLQGCNAVVTKPVPNFTRLDSGRPEIAILMDAMLRAREVVAARPWSRYKSPRANIGGLMFWLILAPGYPVKSPVGKDSPVGAACGAPAAD